MINGSLLLLNCISDYKAEEKHIILKTISEEDWPLIYLAAEKHAVAPLLYYKLKPYKDYINMKPEIWELLRNGYFKNAAINMRFYNTLGTLINAFSNNQIPVIVLKGPHLAATVYNNIALRTMSDIDLLVKPQNIRAAVKILKKLGSIEKDTNIDNRSVNLVYEILATKVTVELHWKLFASIYDCQVNMDDIWRRKTYRELEKNTALTLADEDLLIYLCGHAVKHIKDMNIRMLYDIHLLINSHKDSFNWEEIVLRARRWKLSRALFIMVRLSAELLQTGISREQLSKMRPPDFVEEKYFLVYNQLTRMSASQPQNDLTHNYMHNNSEARIPVDAEQKDRKKDQKPINQSEITNIGTKYINKGNLNRYLSEFKNEARKKINSTFNPVFLPRHEMNLRYNIGSYSPLIIYYYLKRIKEELIIRYLKKLFVRTGKVMKEKDCLSEEDNRLGLLRRWLLSD